MWTMMFLNPTISCNFCSSARVPELVKALSIAPSRAERRQSTGKLQPFTGGGSGVARANPEIAALRGSARWSAFAGRLKKQILELLEKWSSATR
jgi:hypothetical protein